MHASMLTVASSELWTISGGFLAFWDNSFSFHLEICRVYAPGKHGICELPFFFIRQLEMVGQTHSMDWLIDKDGMIE